jgi:hypothetical protein
MRVSFRRRKPQTLTQWKRRQRNISAAVNLLEEEIYPPSLCACAVRSCNDNANVSSSLVTRSRKYVATMHMKMYAHSFGSQFSCTYRSMSRD